MTRRSDSYTALAGILALGLLSMASACSPHGETSDLPAREAESDASTGADGGDELDATAPRDNGVSGADAAGAATIDFVLSGSFRGSARLVRSEGGEPSKHETRAVVTEFGDPTDGTPGRIEGLLRLFEPNGTAPRFEYVLQGELTEDRSEVRLELGARRCPFGTGNCEDALPAESVPETPMLQGRAIFVDGRLEIEELERNPAFEPPADRALRPRLTGAGLTPEFDPDDERFSPGDGVKPTGLDTTVADVDTPSAVPLGETRWTGTLTNASVVRDASTESVDCNWEIYHGGSGLELRSFDCGGRRIAVEEASTAEVPRVVPGSFETKSNATVVRNVWFLVEGKNTHHLFVGERVGHLFSGVVVRDPELRETESGETRAAHPLRYSPARVEGAFNWTRE